MSSPRYFEARLPVEKMPWRDIGGPNTASAAARAATDTDLPKRRAADAAQMETFVSQSRSRQMRSPTNTQSSPTMYLASDARQRLWKSRWNRWRFQHSRFSSASSTSSSRRSPLVRCTVLADAAPVW